MAVVGLNQIWITFNPITILTSYTSLTKTKSPYHQQTSKVSTKRQQKCTLSTHHHQLYCLLTSVHDQLKFCFNYQSIE